MARRAHILVALALFIALGAVFFAESATISELEAQLLRLESELRTLSSGQTASAVFPRDLKEGDSGADVKALQVLLNGNLATRVAAVGPGSRGQESLYFGAKTKDAVRRFQEKYAAEVLTPAGLSRGTGFFGPLSRKKAEFLLRATAPVQTSHTQTPSSSVPPTGTPTTQTQASPTTTKTSIEENAPTTSPASFDLSEPLTLSFPTIYELLPGERYSIPGTGFLPTANTVHIGEHALANVSAEASTELSLVIPRSISPGLYEVAVSNQKGKTVERALLIIKDSNRALPIITAVSPASGGYGTRITITGSGFSAAGNEVRSGYGIIKNLSSANGTEITFDVTPFPEHFSGGGAKNITWPLYFYVLNAGGISPEPGEFILNL